MRVCCQAQGMRSGLGVCKSCLLPGPGHVHWTRLMRAGWAVASVGPDGRPESAAYGLVPRDICPRQLARYVEDYAVLMLARLAEGIRSIRIDCIGTLSCFEHRVFSVWASNARAHLWRETWMLLGPGAK